MNVYHASGKVDLSVISPNVGTHGLNCIYASVDMVIASLFLSTVGGDYTCAIGRDPFSGKPFVCERFKGAFDERYANRDGMIYKLDGTLFSSNVTSWSEEVVCFQEVAPLEAFYIGDVEEYLRYLQSNDLLIIKMYPDRFEFIPDDDEDLIDRTYEWIKMHPKEDILNSFRYYHRGLEQRLVKRLAPTDL